MFAKDAKKIVVLKKILAMRFPFFLITFLIALVANAQPSATRPVLVQQSLASIETQKMNSLVKQIPFENIGPKVMSGRVVALAVNPKDPTEFYVAYASGGVWHTTDNGISFTPISENAPTQNIGEIAMHWPTRTLWVGTGENNASRSSYAGIGLLKTENNGQSWEQAGLPDSHHIGKILIDANNPEHVVVGVTGHLYSPNEQRGVYVTQDGGATWKNTLSINDSTGIIDMAHAPENFNVQFAAAWSKDRKAWNFTGNGQASAIYKSTDAGQTWQKVSTPESGFPTGEGVGRIGLAVYDESTVYAIHDAQFRRPKKEAQKEKGLQKDDFKSMTKEAFLALDNKALNTFLKTNNFQEKYRAENLKNSVRSGSVAPKDLATYLEDANSLLFDTPVVGTEVYKSTDGGLHWEKTHTDYLDDIYYSYGYYFGHIHVHPKQENKIYIYGVPILTSDDGGKSFRSIGKSNVHADHHALWINPNRSGHLINGNDGGVNITYNDGANWMKNNSVDVGQFYAINIDHATPYNVYGGLQDNGVWKGAHNGKDNESWQSTGHNVWTSIMGGDGMKVQIDRRDNNVVYTGFQFGNYYRLNLATKARKAIQPKHTLGESPYRFNWQTPILLSEHNQDILYYGGNKLHRSLNQGDDWTTISDDLTQGGKIGNVAYGTLTTLSESPFQFGYLYTGSDDGLVYKTTNGGDQWTLISSSFPQDLWVSRVVASAHQKDRVYVTLNGYRWDDFTPYVYVSEDGGEHWTALANNLPHSPVNVIREDPVNENVIYLGNDMGVWISLDRGQQWHPFVQGLTNAAVHDLVIQPEKKHLLVGTHGRSIYKAEIAHLQQSRPENLMLFPLKKVRHSSRWGNSYSQWREAYTPSTSLTVYAPEETSFALELTDNKGKMVYRETGNLMAGYNVLKYDMRFAPPASKKRIKTKLEPSKNGITYLSKGTYTMVVKTAQNISKQTLLIE